MSEECSPVLRSYRQGRRGNFNGVILRSGADDGLQVERRPLAVEDVKVFLGTPCAGVRS